MKFGCSICGHKQEKDTPCEDCGSIRVVSIAVLEKTMGMKWEDNEWYTLEEIANEEHLK